MRQGAPVSACGIPWTAFVARRFVSANPGPPAGCLAGS